jgi:hypothetical protein
MTTTRRGVTSSTVKRATVLIVNRVRDDRAAFRDAPPSSPDGAGRNPTDRLRAGRSVRYVLAWGHVDRGDDDVNAAPGVAHRL